MTPRLRIGLLSVTLGLTLVAAACAAAPATPTRPPIQLANVIATATVMAGGVPGGTPAAGGGSPGAQLFASQGCIACHMIKGQGGAVGPNLSTIGTDAAKMVPGQSAAEYLRTSITNPNAFVVPGYQPGIMPQTFGTTLSQAQIDELVQYLLEQK